MASKREVVADTTDPGTLRPNIAPEPTTGDQFEPLECPPFSPKINLLATIDPNDAFAIWNLFMPPEQLQIISWALEGKRSLDSPMS